MEDFNGPLDLILYLLSKNKMEIKDIQIALILEQYLEWMDRRKEMDLEIASEFVTMAAHLVYIKTRMLLSIQDEEAASEMEQLIASLEEHQRHENYDRIQKLIPTLDQRFRIGRDYITRPPQPLPKMRTYRYVHQPEDLRRAMMEVLQRADAPQAPVINAFDGIVGHEPYPVQDKIKEVLSRVLHAGITRFRALFRGSRSRSEIVATFLAVLELCKGRRIYLAGTETDCTVTGREDSTPEEAASSEEITSSD
jgi:segregation and condensation protein A